MKTYFPMLAQDSTEITVKDGKVDINSKYFGNKDWIMEIKFDGARYILQWDEEGKVHFTSRHVSVKDNLPTDKTENLRGYLFEDCPAMAGTVLDGEVIVMQKVGEKTMASCNDCGWKESHEFKGGLTINCAVCKKMTVPKLNTSPLWKMTGDNGSAETNRIMLASPDKAKERLKNPDIKLIYIVYDILSYRKPIYDVTTDAKGFPVGKGKIKGYEITDVTKDKLFQRKAYLEDAMIDLDNDPIMREFARKKMMLSMNFKNQTPQEGKAQFEVLVKDGHEGVMLKNLNSPYVQGDHSAYWQKVKKMLTCDGVVLGMNTGTGKYKETMGALVIGQWFLIPVEDKQWTTLNAALSLAYKENEICASMGKNYYWNWDVKANPEEGVAESRTKRIYELKEVCTLSGMTDEERNKYSSSFKERIALGECYQEGTKVRFYNDKIATFAWVVEFIAQEKTKTRYRHPRFLHNRDDKNIWDCLF